MAFININSRPTVTGACDLFTVPPTQRSVEQGYVQEYRPISSLESLDAPIEFNIPATSNEYIDLSHTRLRVRIKITNDKNEVLKTECKVAPVNNFIHSLFSNVQIELNNKAITSQTGNYAYRALIENLLNYGADAKESHLTTSLFYKDTSGNMGAVETNLGYVKRRQYAQNGEFDMESVIHSDIFNSNKYMLNGVQMLIKLFKSKAQFALMTAAGDEAKYVIHVTDAVLLVRKLKMSDALLIAHATTMLKHSAFYPITRVETKNITIGKDIQNFVLDNVVLGQIPQRVLIGFVDAASYNGDFHGNPFDFQHFNHNFLTIATDSSVHVTPLKPNYAKKLFISSYNTLFYATGITFSDSGSDITREDFANGYNLSVFDLTPDLSAHEAHYTQPSTGSLRIEVQFDKNLAKPITAIIFLEYTNCIEIDRFRTVSIDYAA